MVAIGWLPTGLGVARGWLEAAVKRLLPSVFGVRCWMLDVVSRFKVRRFEGSRFEARSRLAVRCSATISILNTTLLLRLPRGALGELLVPTLVPPRTHRTFHISRFSIRQAYPNHLEPPPWPIPARAIPRNAPAAKPIPVSPLSRACLTCSHDRVSRPNLPRSIRSRQHPPYRLSEPGSQRDGAPVLSSSPLPPLGRKKIPKDFCSVLAFSGALLVYRR